MITKIEAKSLRVAARLAANQGYTTPCKAIFKNGVWTLWVAK